MIEGSGPAPVRADAHEALAEVIERRWDPDTSLQRLSPGAAPGLADRADRLHVIRESALAALFDLGRGQADGHRRAVDTIEAVLSHQYPLDGTSWAGTFRVVAEQPTPGADATVWLDYDPNWRQFVGMILATIVDRFGPELPPDLVARTAEAVGRCVAGEPHDRIPRWYTNPNLMHAWLQGWVGRRNDDESLIVAGQSRVAALMERFDTYGDVDEYNSPTYDGIDLVAAGLWAGSPPTDVFADAGRRLLEGMGSRISATYHPALRAAAGPYIRTYGFGLDRYVSLSGLWWSLAGEEGALPPVLDAETDHVHDLYFLALCDPLVPVVVPALRARPVHVTRAHTQRFRTTEATTTLWPDAALGVERGRRSPFSRDQYAPLVAHWAAASGATQWLGVMLGDGTHVDAEPGAERRAVVRLEPAFPASGADLVVRIVGSEPPELDGPVLSLDRATLTFERPPSAVERLRSLGGGELLLRFPSKGKPTARSVVADFVLC